MRATQAALNEQPAEGPDLQRPSCDPCLTIGEFYFSQPVWKRAMAVPLIYFPIATTIPFTVGGNVLLRASLALAGARSRRSIMDYLPAWVSHRYTMETQIVMDSRFQWSPFTALELLKGTRAFWIFNCKMYCPASVALFRHTTHLLEESHKPKPKKSRLGGLLQRAAVAAMTPTNKMGNFLVRRHLGMMGAQNLDEVNRYAIETDSDETVDPMKSEALKLIGSTTKLIEIVEAWWCPFNHEAKESYARIDHSAWGVIPREKAKLHPDDRDNPQWENGQPIVDTRTGKAQHA
ncbi:MAG: hypothetical protein JRH20_22715 [Deltaproteobacteria bacterium]|nr:hypothetical protein [Deltaproteobacteria bacterium]